MDDKQLAANLSMLAIQFSALNQIVMALLMETGPDVLKAARETIQERLATLQEGTADHHSTLFALAQLNLALNGPNPKTQLSLVLGTGNDSSGTPPKKKKGGGIMIRFETD